MKLEYKLNHKWKIIETKLDSFGHKNKIWNWNKVWNKMEFEIEFEIKITFTLKQNLRFKHNQNL